MLLAKVIAVCAFLNSFFNPISIQKTDKTADSEKLSEMEKEMMKRKAQLYEIEQSLPKKNSLYLKVRFWQFRKNIIKIIEIYIESIQFKN